MKAEVRGNAVETEIPLEQEGGTFVVPVSINDTIALKFTIDSGAADVSIPADVASTLVRSGTITQDDFIGRQTYVLADGSQVPSAVFRIKTLKVGTLVLHDVTGSLADARGQLLLGQSFLSRLSSWSIDNRRQVLVLKALAAPGVEAASAPEVAARTDPSVEAQVADASLRELAASKKAKEYFTAWSDPRDPEGATIRPFYAETVNFYGQDIAVTDLMVQKVQFGRRWPSRTYVPRIESLNANCLDEHICLVTGLVDWETSDGGTRHSAGVANFKMRLRDGLIEAEGGSVLARR